MEDNELQLHPETVKMRQDTYSSLTDLSGICIFSDDFKEIKERVSEQETEKLTQTQVEMFQGKNCNNYDPNQEVMTVLFQKKEEIILTQEYQKNSTNTSFLSAGCILITILAVLFLYSCFFRDKKKEKEGGKA